MRSVLQGHDDQAADLEGLLYRALFGISSTWYVELAAGDTSRVFDIDVVTEKSHMPGNITVHKLLDKSGRLVEAPEAMTLEKSGSHLRIRDLRLKGSLTLAFKINPPRYPVEFDVRIDTGSAADRTYIGEALEKPEAIPFVLKGKRLKARAATRPGKQPAPPYVLVWYEESLYRDDTSIKLDDETRKELRALGYIQ
jgi:hypothetical protein